MKKLIITLNFLVLGLILTSCNLNTNNNDLSTSGVNEVISDDVFSSSLSLVLEPNISESVTVGDYITSETDVLINLDNELTTITNTNGYCEYLENVITITGAGTYVFSGKLTDGQITISASSSDKVYIVLNGVSISSNVSAAIYSLKSDKTFVVLSDNSSNYLSDSSDYTYASTTSEEPNACLFSKNDLTIKGNGSLTVIGNFNNGIGTKDDLNIKDNPTISVTALNNAIKGNDSIEIDNGNITVSAKEDAIKSDNTEDVTKGFITIYDGVFNITSGNDAITASNLITIDGGTINIITGNSSAYSLSSSDSFKGIKCDGEIIINSGDISIDSNDDAIHAHKALTINNGSIYISSGDDGIHSDAALTINGGAISIVKAYEGIEGVSININGGKIKLVATDDGVNAAGGVDSSSTTTNRPGGFGGAASSSTGSLAMTGGYIYVISTGDGIDVNGSLTMSGGTILVNGPTDNGNGPMDYDGTFTMTGGILIATGSSGMSQNISSSSSQCGILVKFSTISANTMINVTNSQGNEIATFVPTKAYQSIVISTPLIVKNETYNFYTGGSYLNGTVEDGLYTGGTYTVGTKITSVSVSSVVTTK